MPISICAGSAIKKSPHQTKCIFSFHGVLVQSGNDGIGGYVLKTLRIADVKKWREMWGLL